jgi:lysozyme family protein
MKKAPAKKDLSINYLIGNIEFEGMNKVEKISAPPALWERMKRYCKELGIRYSKFVQDAILEKLNAEDYDN